ncbi:MAG TPA: AMP-binding protein, partial [Acidimicrobiia bacterium]|nr:AMP-binding protein [Acidimicrobiia bacterium]
MANEILTIPVVLARAADRAPGDEALVTEDARATFRELADQATIAAHALLASGVRPGDRGGIWAPNCGEWVVAALGVFAAGAVLVPINTRFKGGEARYVLERADAKLLFSVSDFLDADYIAALRAEAPLPELAEIVDLRGPSWHEFLARAGDEPLPAVAPEDVCSILFTSGTTGRPKGAMLTHEATVRAYTAWSDVVGLRAGDRYLIVNPFFHSFGLNAGIIACLLTGATIVPHAVFDVDTVMARVVQEHISMLPGPPTVYQSILDHPRLAEFDMTSLRLAVTGAATVPVELIRRMRADLGFETIATTCGRAIPGTEVAVVDDDGRPVPAGEPGEVVVRGYNVMQGFLDDPAATAEAIDADGWLHTGDVAVMNDRGDIRITDRMKEMFIVGGFNAYP